MNLTSQESRAIADLISTDFYDIQARYNFIKYPSEDYAQYKIDFSSLEPTIQSIPQALLWKWGKLNYPNYPQNHRNLIQETVRHWQNFVRAPERLGAESTFEWWQRSFGRTTTYITAAYITHLVHEIEAPIIDQHNFRAINYLTSKVRPSHTGNKKPSKWAHIAQLKNFTSDILNHLPGNTTAEFDRFLMMYGRDEAPR